MAVAAETLLKGSEYAKTPVDITEGKARDLLRKRIGEVRSRKRDYKWVSLLRAEDRYRSHINPTTQDLRGHPGYRLFGYYAGEVIVRELMGEAGVDLTLFDEKIERVSYSSEKRVRSYSTKDPLGKRLVFKTEELGFGLESVGLNTPRLDFYPLNAEFFVRKV